MNASTAAESDPPTIKPALNPPILQPKTPI
jgi:hypothetical protein